MIEYKEKRTKGMKAKKITVRAIDARTEAALYVAGLAWRDLSFEFQQFLTLLDMDHLPQRRANQQPEECDGGSGETGKTGPR